MTVFNSELHRRELTQLCQSLVQTPSVNGVHAEKQVAELIAQFSRKHDLHVEQVEREPDRPNVLVRVGPEGEAALLLIAHMDTVSAGGEERWTHPPFGAEIVGGRLYGRGAADNKGGLVAGLAALIKLKEESMGDLRLPVLLACVPDEESGATGWLGVRYLKELGKLSAKTAIYTYPGVHRVIIGHRGVLRTRIIAHGMAVHSGSTRWSNGTAGCNAVSGMSEIILALENIKFKGVSSDGSCNNFGAIITPTIISGGTDRSVVPDYCEAVIDIRFGPTVSRDVIEDKISEVVAKIVQRRPPLRVQVVPDIFIPPTLISPTSMIVSTLRESAKRIFGREPSVAISGPANESYILNGFGIPTCVFGPKGGHAHAVDEYVVIDSIFKVAAVYALTARLLMSNIIKI